MARLENIITSMVDLFLEYADDQGHKRKLCKEEFKAMLEKEIDTSELRGKISAENIDEVMKKLDKNNDEEIQFKEFLRCVSILAKTYFCHKTGRSPGKGKCKGKGAQEEDD